MGCPVSFVAVGNDLRGGLAGPRNMAQGAGIRTQDHVGVSRLHEVPVVIGIFPGHRLYHDRLGQLVIPLGKKLMRRNKLTPCVTGHIRNDAFNFRNFVFREPVGNRVHVATRNSIGRKGLFGRVDYSIGVVRFSGAHKNLRVISERPVCAGVQIPASARPPSSG